MFNPLNLFKKRNVSQPNKATPEIPKEQPVQIDNIAIHTMPARFRNQPTNQKDQTKSAGLLIMAGGLIALLISGGLLYFYLFRNSQDLAEEKPALGSGEVNEQAPAEAEEEAAPEETAVAPVATSTLPEILPDANEIATSTATTTPENLAEDLAVGLIPSLDSDGDGLTDAEEILLKVSTSTPDTDGDGYLDGAEILNLYDPASTTKLSLNPEIMPYGNGSYNYSLLYPKAFALSDNGGDDSIMLATGDNQLFQIIVQANSGGQTLDEWYEEQLDSAAISENNRVAGKGWQGIKNLDGLTVYIIGSKQDYIFTIAYNPGENNILDYINIFNMMIKSFSLE